MLVGNTDFSSNIDIFCKTKKQSNSCIIYIKKKNDLLKFKALVASLLLRNFKIFKTGFLLVSSREFPFVRTNHRLQTRDSYSDSTKNV